MPLRQILFASTVACCAASANAATPFFEFEMGRGEQEVQASETGLTIVLDGALQSFATIEKYDTDVTRGRVGLTFDTSGVEWLGPTVAFSLGGKHSSGDGETFGIEDLAGTQSIDAAMALADGTGYAAAFLQGGSTRLIASVVLPGSATSLCSTSNGPVIAIAFAAGSAAGCSAVASPLPSPTSVDASASGGGTTRMLSMSYSDGTPADPSWKNWSHTVSEQTSAYDARFETGLTVLDGVAIKASFAALYGTGDRQEARHQRVLVQTPYYFNVYQTSSTALTWRDIGLGLGATAAYDFDPQWGLEVGAQIGLVQRQTDAAFALRQEFRSISFYTGSFSDFVYETDDDRFAGVGELSAKLSFRPIEDIQSLKVSLTGSYSYDTARPNFALDAPLLQDAPQAALTPGSVAYEGQSSYSLGLGISSEL